MLKLAPLLIYKNRSPTLINVLEHRREAIFY